MYTDKDYENTKKAATTRVLLGIALGLIFLAGVVVLNRFRLQYAEMALAAFGFCFTYFIWSFKISPWTKYNKFLRDMKNGQRRSMTCEFVSLAPETRAHDGVDVHELIVTVGAEEEDERLFYWDADKPQPQLKAGEKLKITSFGNFVVELNRA